MASAAQSLGPPPPLPGRSSEKLRRLGYLGIVVGGTLGVANALLGAATRSFAVSGSGLGITLIVVIIGWLTTMQGYRKRKAERERGYTVDMTIGRLHPDLWILNFRTLEPLYPPEEMPADMSAKLQNGLST